MDPVRWQDASDLLHIYTVEEIERQVYARLQPIDGVRRVSEYNIPASRVSDVEVAANAFSSSFPRPTAFAWNGRGQSQSKDQNKVPQTPSDMTMECDLYLKLLPGTSIRDLFNDCADEVVHLNQPVSTGSGTSWADLAPTEDRDVLLAEVAETPESLRTKLWQLQRAMQFGPAEFRTNAFAAVVCIDGEKPKFVAACDAINVALGSTSAIGWELFTSVPVFAIWTPYRNVYTEMKSLKSDIAELKSDVAGVKSDIAGLRTDVAGLRTEVTANSAKLDAILEKLGVAT